MNIPMLHNLVYLTTSLYEPYQGLQYQLVTVLPRLEFIADPWQFHYHDQPS